MARPRVFVNRSGKIVASNTGVSVHRSTKRFYVISSSGNRQYFKDWDTARAAALAQEEAPDEAVMVPGVPGTSILDLAGVTATIPNLDELSTKVAPFPWQALARAEKELTQQLLESASHQLGREGGAVEANELRFGQYQFVSKEGLLAFVRSEFRKDPEGFAERLGVRIVPSPENAPAKGPSLSQLATLWRNQKTLERGEVTRHWDEIAHSWEEFVRIVGNVKIDQMTPGHFRKYHEWLGREGKKRSAHWKKSRLAKVLNVLRYTRRKFPDLPWPNGILEWAAATDIQPYRPKAANRQPITPNHFQSLLAATRSWATIIPSQSGNSDTQSGRAKRLQAQRKQRDGVQCEAVLSLMLNCGLDSIDIERMTWENVILNAAIPHLKMGRRKTEHSLGEAIMRITPLLPSTVNALRKWRAFDGKSEGPVFLNASGAPLNSRSICRRLAALKTEAGIEAEFTPKHLRNCGPSVAKRAHLDRDMRDAFLGHVVGGTSRFYEGDVDESYLIPVVNAIGQDYFDGETVMNANDFGTQDT